MGIDFLGTHCARKKFTETAELIWGAPANSQLAPPESLVAIDGPRQTANRGGLSLGLQVRRVYPTVYGVSAWRAFFSGASRPGPGRSWPASRQDECRRKKEGECQEDAADAAPQEHVAGLRLEPRILPESY
jgi:hypothetical protein